MAALSDTTIIAQIKSLIEGDTDLYDASMADASKVHRVMSERDTVDPVYTNTAFIRAPAPGGVDVMDNWAKEEATERKYILEVEMRQLQPENNTKLYDWVANLRDAVYGDPRLGPTAGVIFAHVVGWGYELNEKGTMHDMAVVIVQVRTEETF